MRALFLAGVLAIGLSGCATITRGTTEDVQLQSAPEDARAATSTGQSCQTPCTVKVGRKDEFSVTFTKEGYQPQQVEVKTQVAGAGAAGMAGNLVFGGIIGAGTDYVTGATLDHVPNPVKVDLVPNAPVRPAAPAMKRRVKRTPKPAPAV